MGIGSNHSFISGVGLVKYKPRVQTASREEDQSNSKRRGDPPTTGMARDYDYLFKLLIIGDSGKRIPGMRNGKWASPGIYTMSRRKLGRGS